MGGLRKLMPRTALAMLIGALALVGIPPFAGFFAKDAVLAGRARARHVRRDPLGGRRDAARSSPASTPSG